MAMQQLSRNIRCCANKFSVPAKSACGERFSIGVRPYSSSPLSQIQGQEPAATLPRGLNTIVNASGVVMFVYWTDCFFGDNLRAKYADWKGKKKAQAMLEELESKKNESAEAYLVVLEREANALKAKLLNRPVDVSNMRHLLRRDDMMEFCMNIRQIDALDEKVFSWADKEDK